jgi:hypothetical protein
MLARLGDVASSPPEPCEIDRRAWSVFLDAAVSGLLCSSADVAADV